jgi:hypothetical protein
LRFSGGGPDSRPVCPRFDENSRAAASGRFVVRGYRTGKLTGTYSGGGATRMLS